MNKPSVETVWHDMFIDCLVDLHAHNVKVVLVKNGLTLDGEQECRGYWDDDDWRNPELHCLVKKDENWMQTFVHEYCHFRQFKERSDVWKRMRRYTVKDDEALFSNAPMHRRRLHTYIKDVRNLELDCEQRTVEMFKHYKAPLSDIKTYIKYANIYLNFYTYQKWYREWPTMSNSPLTHPECFAAAHDTFQQDYDAIPTKLLKVFAQLYPAKCEIDQ